MQQAKLRLLSTALQEREKSTQEAVERRVERLRARAEAMKNQAIANVNKQRIASMKQRGKVPRPPRGHCDDDDS